MPGSLVYEPVLLAMLDDGRIMAEVYRYVYHKAPDPLLRLHEVADNRDGSARIDWALAEQIVHDHDGPARNITLHGKTK